VRRTGRASPGAEARSDRAGPVAGAGRRTRPDDLTRRPRERSCGPIMSPDPDIGTRSHEETPRMAHHGNTPAAWTGVMIILVGFVVGGIGLVVDSMTLFWVGVVLLPIGAIV